MIDPLSSEPRFGSQDLESAAGEEQVLAVSDPARPSPQVMPRTGDERVDAALARLHDLSALPLAAQVTVFDDVHRLLQDALTDKSPRGDPSAAAGRRARTPGNGPVA